MVPGGPTDDDGWGDAADEQVPRRPTIVAWDDEDEDEDGGDDRTEPEPEPVPEPEAEPESEPEPEPESEPADQNREADLAAPGVPTEGPKTAAEKPKPAKASREPKRAAVDEPWGGSLAEAAGIDTPPPRPPRPPILSRRGWFFLVAFLIVAALLTAGGITSHLNSQRRYLVCGDDDVRAERGRWFPWGQTRLEGDRWKPFELRGACESREVDSESELEAAFLELLINRLNTTLAAEDLAELLARSPESAEGATDLEKVEVLIDQGMALARAPEHKAQRTELERLRGDVEYWRGRAALQRAVERLEAARGHLEEAYEIGPRHAGDAGDWSAFIERLIERAKGGPGEEEPPRPTSGDAGAPRPAIDAAPPAVPIVIPDAGPPPATEPDAGVPPGGVLL